MAERIHAASFAILLVMLAALVPLAMSGTDAAGEPDLSIYRYTPKLTMTSDNFGAVKYIVWDFGDGTVLDGRWEYWAEKQENGETLPAEIVAGIGAYKALLAENGNSLIVTTHTYAQKGTYTATAVAMNPLGYVPEGGTAYDGVLNQDSAGYDGGLDNPASADITSPTDATIDSDGFKAVAGSWCRVSYVVEIKGYPTMTFDTKGGSVIAPMQVENTSEYAVATMPTDPTKQGCSFDGWYTDEACTQPYNWTLKVTAPMTLYAGWTPTSQAQYDHVITYRDGTAVLGTQNVRNGTDGNVDVAISQEDPTKEGKVFLGWIASTEDTPISKGGTVSVPVTGLVLSAYWGEAGTTYSHIIRYDPNGGTGTMADAVVKDGAEGNILMVLANCGFNKEGHIFKGWLVGTAVKQPGARIQVGGDQTVIAKAQWEASATPVAAISVYVDGQATPFYIGQTVADIVKPIHNGYSFDGWYADASFNDAVAETVPLADGMTLYSKMVQSPEQDSSDDDDDLLPIAFIVVGAVISLIGLFVHPLALLVGLAVAALGALGLFDIIDLL